jgi:hypothetical protein
VGKAAGAEPGFHEPRRVAAVESDLTRRSLPSGGSILQLGAGWHMGKADHVEAVLAGRDRVVDTQAARRLIARSVGRSGVPDDIPGAEHDLLRGAGAVRRRAFAAAAAFLERA